MGFFFLCHGAECFVTADENGLGRIADSDDLCCQDLKVRTSAFETGNKSSWLVGKEGRADVSTAEQMPTSLG